MAIVSGALLTAAECMCPLHMHSGPSGAAERSAPVSSIDPSGALRAGMVALRWLLQSLSSLILRPGVG